MITVRSDSEKMEILCIIVNKKKRFLKKGGVDNKYKKEKGAVFMSKRMRFWMMGVLGVMMAAKEK